MKKTTGTIPVRKIETTTEEDLNSVEVKKDAKGKYGWTIKRYSPDGLELPELIAKTDKKLRKLFKDKEEK